jgi:hypothetical protein
VRRRKALRPHLWPDKYLTDSPETLTRFLFAEVWTWNEADKCVAKMPTKDYLEGFAHLWWESRRTGEQLVIEKSRRMIVSWAERGMMVWSMGLQREDRLVAGQTFDDAANFVWRCWFIYDQILMRRPSWQLKPPQYFGSFENNRLTSLVLPNRARVTVVNQEKGKIQGSGYAGVHAEELALFRRPDQFLAQAALVTQGAVGGVGGHTVAITNADANEHWQRIKRGERGR